ncbi:MAG: class I SAM-dependent methyltransferase [Pirellulales bacterium]|nr:class I SAM-dependent methyltransferase [Pirellulales bacterium]
MQTQTQSRTNNSLAELIGLLRCVECKASDLMLAERGDRFEDCAMRASFGGQMIVCQSCHACYPVSTDGIPVMWTSALRKYIDTEDEAASALAANIATYDRISDDYTSHRGGTQEHSRRLSHAVDRLVGIRAVTPHSRLPERWHLDFGCGPGQVFCWLEGAGFRQVGLDVSLNNLRNTRNRTGAYVVLGSADDMPFRDDAFDLVTESLALHHIEDWRSTIKEACRVCGPRGGVIIDSEPSREFLNWSRLARVVFEGRWYVYKLLSYFIKDKYIFRNVKQAKLNYRVAEVHNQPGRGFSAEELEELFRVCGYDAEVVRSPDEQWRSVARVSWQAFILRILSLQSPWNPVYGQLGVLARNTQY